MVMMLFIEYINVRTHGRSFERLKKSSFGQIVLGALLGIIPGCIGGFAAVSLFTHGLFSFGALLAMTIATTGDEAFVLLAMNPGTALLVTTILFVLAIGCGCLVNRLVKNVPVPFADGHYTIHAHDHEHPLKRSKFWPDMVKNIRHITFERALLLGGLLLFIIAMLSGLLEHSHATGSGHIHEAGSGHGHHLHAHAEPGNILFGERWLNLIFAGVSVLTFFLIASVDNHFLEEHLWGHVIKKHFPKIFCWTLGTLVVVHLLLHYAAINTWISDNRLLVLLAAILIGLIPESGPHLLFISLFATGTIPFSILLTNSFVQDGHTTLPLLAESPRTFIRIKIIKTALGLLVGLCGYFLGF